ncbi:MAG: hypothetical protein AAB953_03540 [Patescibacteria group bacterium]
MKEQSLYHILWPGGNTTALVTKKFPRNKHVKIAKQILNKHENVEQVGFLEKPKNSKADIHLQMMGGEFCGNAARAAAFLEAMKNNKKSFKLEVSGFPEILDATIIGSRVALTLPGSFFIKMENKKEQSQEIQIVDLMGIRFILKKFIKQNAISEAKKLIKKYKNECPAVGVIYLSKKGNKIVIDPVVCVKKTDTCYNETACGSGSIAAAIAEFKLDPTKKSFSVIQPSKVIYAVTIIGNKNKINKIKFQGPVKHLGLCTEV